MMKILIVSQYFWPESFQINEISKSLKELGHEIEVLTGIPNYPQGKFYDGYGIFKNRKQNYNGIKIHRVPIIPRGKKGGDKRLIPNYLSFVLMGSIAVLFKIFKKYDVILVYGTSPITQAYPALLLRWITKVPVCLYVYDLWPEALFAHGIGKKPFIKKLLYKIVYGIYKRSDKIFISSEGFRNSIISSGYDSKNLHYIPNWADDFYRPLESTGFLRKQLNLDKNTFIVMYAGNIGHAQSFDTVLEAAKILKDNKKIYFVILGDGTLKQWAENKAIEYGLKNIFFLGRKPAEEMPKYFAEADAMIVSLAKGYNRSLTLPGRVQAFMKSGKPILACADGETSRVIKESGAGLTCEAEDYVGLASMIKKISEMPKEELDKMKKNALNYYQRNFNKEKLLKKIEKLLKECKRLK